MEEGFVKLFVSRYQVVCHRLAKWIHEKLPDVEQKVSIIILL